MCAGAGLALLLAALAQLPLRATLRRLAPVNVFVLLMWLLLPLTGRGEALAHVGPVAVSAEGCRVAGQITLKANAVLLLFTALVGTMDVSTLGHALHHLRAPEQLAHLFLFTVRYVDVLRHEHGRLAQAMKVRCFRPRARMHTYRSIAHMVGMLLVGSFDRSERIMAAMKCRGFSGRFYLLDHFRAGRRDIVFGLAAGAVVAGLALMEWCA